MFQRSWDSQSYNIKLSSRLEDFIEDLNFLDYYYYDDYRFDINDKHELYELNFNDVVEELTPACGGAVYFKVVSVTNDDFIIDGLIHAENVTVDMNTKITAKLCENGNSDSHEMSVLINNVNNYDLSSIKDNDIINKFKMN